MIREIARKTIGQRETFSNPMGPIKSMPCGWLGEVLQPVLLAICVLAGTAGPAEVAATLSVRESYVGVPVLLQIQVTDAADHEPPRVPEIEGLQIVPAGPPATSSRITIINGRRSQSSSTTYSFQITPRQPGVFTIPSLTVEVDGQRRSTRAMQIVVSKSEASDLMFVEVSGLKDSVYVGESSELTLKLWIQPYRDRQNGIVLSDGDMWNCISEGTNWGPFTERIEEMAAQRKRPGGREVLREDSAGEQHSYYLYEIETNIYQQSFGEVAEEAVEIVVQYPTSLGRSRDPIADFFQGSSPFGGSPFDDDFFGSPFTSRLSVTSVKPIIANARVPNLTVKPIPTDGRPDDYRGAVGRYQIATEATPTKVKAGDPITLHIGITGDGPLDLVQAPPLSDLDELFRDFKVPDNQLAGFVAESQKIFSTTIRPLNAQVQEIPAIPLSYFDPAAEEFVTVYSQPIPIEVEESDMLALDAIEGSSAKEASQQLDESAESTETMFINSSDRSLLKNEAATSAFSSLPLLAILLPPLLVLGLQVTRLRSRLKGLTFRSPIRTLRKRALSAKSISEVGEAFEEFLLRTFSSQKAATAAAAIGVLRTSRQPSLAIQTERLLDECNRLGFDDSQSELKNLSDRAVALAEELNRTAGNRVKRSTQTQSARRAGTTTIAILATGIMFTGQPLPVYAVEPAELNDRQVAILFDEANQLYKQSMSSLDRSPAEAKEAARKAAIKYQQIVDSPVSNSDLYVNLANAYLKSGQTGLAIANYHRAIKLSPWNKTARANLDYAIAMTAVDPGGSQVPATNWLESIRQTHKLIDRAIDARWIGIAAIGFWVGAWLVIGFRVVGTKFAWKSISFLALVLSILCAASYAYSTEQLWQRNRAIVVAAAIELRSGDGGNFPITAEVKRAEGAAVRVLNRRGNWANIQMSSGQSGWLESGVLEFI